MSEESLLSVSDDHSLGKIEMAPGVIEVITSIAASEVAGVASMHGNFATGVAERLGKKAHNKGVKLDIQDSGISIDLYVELQFGVSIPKVAKQLQTNVRQSLRNMTALEIGMINVHIVGIEIDTNEGETKP